MLHIFSSTIYSLTSVVVKQKKDKDLISNLIQKTKLYRIYFLVYNMEEIFL